MFVSFKSACYENNDQITLGLDDSSHPYNVEGTFGFHTRKTFPERNRTVTYNSKNVSHFKFSGQPPVSEQNKQQEIKNAKIKCTQSYESSSDAIAINGINILGYIPVVGLIPCVARLIYPLCNKNSAMHYESKDVKIAEYVRGFFEGIGLGILYLIPDVIITIKRFCCNNHTPEEKLLVSDKV